MVVMVRVYVYGALSDDLPSVWEDWQIHDTVGFSVTVSI